jgi:hypothetical protein
VGTDALTANVIAIRGAIELGLSDILTEALRP